MTTAFYAGAPKVAIIADFLEEGWLSMDLVADRLAGTLRKSLGDAANPVLIRPDFTYRFAGRGAAASRRRNLDRLLNRFWDYPSTLRGIRGDHEIFHVIDHSYAHLVHHLPPDRTVVTCHDLDAFRCLLDPGGERRSTGFRMMSRRILAGMQRAERVICVSESTRDEIARLGLVPWEKLTAIPNGVDPSCSPLPDQASDEEASRRIGWEAGQKLEILHVGSTIPRKRIDVLLRAFAEVQREVGEAVLIRVGGDFTAGQRALARSLGIESAIRVLPQLDRPVLNAVYRRAALLLQTSEREGFGLPVIESLASGTPVLASDLDVFHEVGGEAIEYVPLEDISGWGRAVTGLLQERENNAPDWEVRRSRGLKRAQGYSWEENARRTLEIYKEMVS